MVNNNFNDYPQNLLLMMHRMNSHIISANYVFDYSMRIDIHNCLNIEPACLHIILLGTGLRLDLRSYWHNICLFHTLL